MTKVWTTQNGVTIYIKDMTDQHIINTINYIKRKYSSLVGCEVDEDDLLEIPQNITDWCFEFDDIVKEAEKRKLHKR